MVSPASPLFMRVMGLEATAFDSPEIVTTSAADRFVSVTIVTVIVFAPPATGLLWPIVLVVKLAALTLEQQRYNNSIETKT
jgi:hypothetical protein